MARVLVTGGSGFIGTNLVQSLRLRGDTVLNVDIVAPRRPDHASFWRAVDVADGTRLCAIVEEFAPEYVFHCAARTDLHAADIDAYRVNVVGTENIVNSLQRVKGLKRLVLLSSMLVCRLGYVPQTDDDYSPSTAYGASKVQAEQLLRAR